MNALGSGKSIFQTKFGMNFLRFRQARRPKGEGGFGNDDEARKYAEEKVKNNVDPTKIEIFMKW